MENPGYYSIITADVRYDKSLNASQKLMFSEITTLCNTTGECWASNAYFAELYNVSTRTIPRWLETLRRRGYISIRLEYEPGTRIVSRRVISLMSTPQGQECPGPNDKTGHDPDDETTGTIEKDKAPHDKRCRKPRARKSAPTGQKPPVSPPHDNWGHTHDDETPAIIEEDAEPHDKKVQKKGGDLSPPPCHKCHDPHDTNVMTPHDINVMDNNTRGNNTRTNILEGGEGETSLAKNKPLAEYDSAKEVLDRLAEDLPGKPIVNRIGFLFFNLAKESGSGMRRLNPMVVRQSMIDAMKQGISANEMCQAVLYLFSQENLSKGKYSIIIRRANQLTPDKINQLLGYVDEIERKKPKKSDGGVEGAGIRV